MLRTMTWLSSVLLLGALFGTGLQAQTITAASCNESDVQTALNSVSANGTTVQIPAGTCTWSTPLYTTLSNSVTIQGAGAETPSSSCTFAVGSACATYSGSDQTEIVDGTSGTNSEIWSITTGAASTNFRMTGLAFTSSGTLNNGMVSISGDSQNIRIDHCHFIGTSTFSYNSIYFFGQNYGVVDHNLFTDENGDENAIGLANGASDGTYHGDTAWGASTSFGSNEFMFFENNVFDYSEVTDTHNAIDDCVTGGRAVFRYNTILNGDFLTHPTGHAGEDRGCRAFEVYDNTFKANDTPGNYLYDFFYEDSGTALLWGNSIGTGYENLVILISARTSSSAMGYSESAPPNGWGYCGSSDGPSAWDGNNNSSGYPCLDDPGRGQGDVLSGQYFPNVVDSVSGTIEWPHELLEPVYEWLNTWTPLSGYNSTDYTTNSVASQNRDFYAYTTSFNGTSGVGSGTYANRPSACTAGPGGTYGQSPTGSFGVAYWATDKTTLYVCTATNTWTAYYTPYTYPHPLDTSSSDPPPTPPTDLSATAH